MTDHDALLARLKAVADDLVLKGHPIMAECVEDTRTAIRELQSKLSAAQAQAAMVQEECAKAVCGHCANPDLDLVKGWEREFQADPEPAYWHGPIKCSASAIWLRSISPDAGREILREAERWKEAVSRVFFHSIGEFMVVTDGPAPLRPNTSRESFTAAIDAARKAK